jgi:hypothetical protein
MLVSAVFGSFCNRRTYASDIFLDGAVGRRQDPGDVGDHVEGRLHVLDALDDGLKVAVVVEVRVLADDRGQRRGDGHAAARDDAAAEVQAERHGVWEG